MRFYFTTILFLYFFRCQAEIVTYPVSTNIISANKFIHPSKEYNVEIWQNGKVYPVFVYSMDAMHYTNNSKTTAWVNFSFSNAFTIKVINLTRHHEKAAVFPRSQHIAVHQQGDTISFDINKPGQYSVEFEKGTRIEHPLLIFANPLEQNIFAATDTSIIYFGPGLHEIGQKYLVPSGKKIYIDGGAYVKGQFYSDKGDNISISGRGILSGEDYDARTADHMIHFRNGQNISIEGITIIHAPRFMIVLNGKQHHINNVKMMGWWFSTDGVSTGEDALIENCFFKVNDDAIKLYQNKTTARHCVIWQMENGAPFQLGWNGANDYNNCHVYDMEVIRVEHEWDNENEAVICAIHGGQGHKTNFRFEHIRIDNSNWRIFHLITKPNRWGQWNKERGSMSDMVFENITIYGKQNIPSLVMGHDKKHPVYNLKFKNIIINGEKSSGERKNFIIDNETTWGITFE